jgi:glycerol-3-phosphate dehydrogenase
LIGGTKGSHIIVAPFRGAPATAIYVEAETDKRPFFVIPWNNKYLIGTTDIRYAGDLDHVAIEIEEIAYLLRETNRVLPQAKLTREQILYSYSGVRPLAFTGDQDEQSITRRHFIRSHPELDGLFSIVGGKLTTHRSLAEQTVDLVLTQRSFSQPVYSCKTAQERLPGAATTDFDVFNLNFTENSPLAARTNERLLRIYGTRAQLLLEMIGEDAPLAHVFDSETGAIAAEVVFAFKHELATTLADCLFRRSMVGLNSTRGLTAIADAAAIARRFLSWSGSRVEKEIAHYRNQVEI